MTRTSEPLTAAEIFPRVHAWETLLAAWDRVEENEGVPGIDGVTLDEFEIKLDEHLATLQRDLAAQTYRPQPYLRAWMPKPIGGRRPLAIPTVRDRVAQSGAALVITPILDREFEAASFGFRRGRSVPHAIAQIQHHREQGYQWVVDADIDSFFDEVDHARLLARLRESIPDPDLLRLIEGWITAPVQDGPDLVAPTRGLPQGSPLSPVLANLYLDRFDEALQRRGMKLVRFADDFLVLSKNQPKAEAALELTETLLKELGLRLDPEKTRVTHFDRGFRYLGHLFVRSMVLPSPNRLQRPDPLGTPPGLPPTPSPRRPSRQLRPVTPTPRDTAMARALNQALRAAGRESLLLPESPSEITRPPEPASEPSATAQPAAQGAGAPALPTIQPPPPEPGSPEPEADSPGAEPALAPAPHLAASPFRRTLYIQEQGAVLARVDERLVVKKDDQVLLELPAAKVDQVFVFGRCAITTPAMTFCLQEEIPIVLLSSRGQYYGLIDSPVGDRVSLHRQQFARAADHGFSLVTAKALVRGKLTNCRVLLQRHQRRKGLDVVKQAITELEATLKRLPQAQTLEEVHGHEGNGAARYFEAFAPLLQQDLGFARRVRRPPTDPVNSLLSLGYTLCFYNLHALIRARGLHPYVGHLHLMRDRHPALASDLLEEFRAPIVDSLVLYLVNSKILTAADFYRPRTDPAGACLLKDQARKTFLKHFEQKMGTPITHPHTGDAVDWRRAMDLQVAQMVQWIRGEVSEYRPMEIR